MGDDRLTIDGAGRLPAPALGDEPGDTPGLVQKRRAQRQDVSVLMDDNYFGNWAYARAMRRLRPRCSRVRASSSRVCA